MVEKEPMIMGKAVNLSAAVPIRSGDPGANQISLNLFSSSSPFIFGFSSFFALFGIEGRGRNFKK